MNLKSLHHIYFIGIGGIGMSALARYFHAQGKHIAGYDKVTTPITKNLESLGIAIHYKDDVTSIPEAFKNKDQSLIVYTPAIPESHKELCFFKEHGYTLKKRAQVLGLITKDSFCFAVAGTHGKTTTSTILGHIMVSRRATAFLGGISENYNSNLILGDDEITIVEADEFDRSFLNLAPDIACVTSMDADHLDVYGNANRLQESFIEFSQLVKEKLVVATGLAISGISYGIENDADYSAQNLRIEHGNYVFDVRTPKEMIQNVVFSLPGRHNILNAMAALSMAHLFGVSLHDIKRSLESFKGIHRRFSYRIKTEDFVLIDDYAHHPTEIKAVAHAIKEMYKNKRSLAVFQPHLYSRTRDFIDDFARSLELFDEVLLLEIYPARELPIAGVNSEWLLSKIEKEGKKLIAKKDVISEIKNANAEVVAILGAGDIGLLVDEITPRLQKLQEDEA